MNYFKRLGTCELLFCSCLGSAFILGAGYTKRALATCPDDPVPSPVDSFGLRTYNHSRIEQFVATDDSNGHLVTNISVSLAPDIRIIDWIVNTNALLWSVPVIEDSGTQASTTDQRDDELVQISSLPNLLYQTLNNNGYVAFVAVHMDVDTRKAGTIWFTNPVCHWDRGGMMIATWDNVGYWKEKDDYLSLFQIAAYSGEQEGDAIIEYRFADFPYFYNLTNLDWLVGRHPFSGIIAKGQILMELPLSQQEWVKDINTYNDGLWVMEVKNQSLALKLNDKLLCRHTEVPMPLEEPPFSLPALVHERPDPASSFDTSENEKSSAIRLLFTLQAGDGKIIDTLEINPSGSLRFDPQYNSQISSPVEFVAYSAISPENTQVNYGYKNATTFIVSWQQDLGDGLNNLFSIRLLSQPEEPRTTILFDYEELQPVGTDAEAYPFAGITLGGQPVMELRYSGVSDAHKLQRDYRGIWEVEITQNGYRLILPRHLACQYQKAQGDNLVDVEVSGNGGSDNGVDETTGAEVDINDASHSGTLNAAPDSRFIPPLLVLTAAWAYQAANK